MPPQVHFDVTTLDHARVLADREAIRRVNPQRHEMEQIDGILLFEPSAHLVIGYKDVRDDEFWVRGHMPAYPLLPGVLICEAAAQLVSYYYSTQMPDFAGDFIGFGGMDNVRFRGPVRPGDRLLLVGKAMRIHRRQCVFNVQGFVGGTMVFEGDVIGIAMRRQAEA